MQGKVTVISPPDIFENSNLSILFLHLSDEDQDTVSKWLSTHEYDGDVNLYVYTNESNPEWILYASSVCQHKYIDLNSVNAYTQALSGYLLGTKGYHYKIDDQELAAVYGCINTKRIGKIEDFLEGVFKGA